MDLLAATSPLLKKDKFLFGTATSAFQIEGGANLGGRSPSIWDDFCREPGRVKGGDDGTRGTDHYHRIEEDVALIKELGFDAYRFSFSWSRLLPKRGQINPEGIAFYQRLLRSLDKAGIAAHATLYHWDLPSYLEEHGGWINRETAYAFQEYATLIAQTFGSELSSIATLNEPFCSAFCGYLWGVHAPGYQNRSMAYQAAHHLLLAHGLGLEALRTYNPQGRAGIVLNFTPAYPDSSKEEDQKAALLANLEHNHWFIKALLEGEYPKELIKKAPDCKPVMGPKDMELIHKPLDFLGVNFYTRQVVKKGGDLYEPVVTDADKTDIGWDVSSESFYDLFTTQLAAYKLPPVYITENGAAYHDGPNEKGIICDQRRMNYYRSHLKVIERLVESGHDIRGYFAWSLMDNFEWAEGYSQRFGLVYVDYETMTRTIKESGRMFQNCLTRREP